ncbi:Ig-like domain-containing protein [Emticicia soli]|uniref:PA14 domain-containing protein n=1 Tax=Emticicia soli TaxID=2027878 RepID=A0ABW5JDB7_9BACT
MPCVIENTYCSPEFNNLKRSLFWPTYVNYKRAIGLYVYIFLSFVSSVFAQNTLLSNTNHTLLSANSNFELSGQTVASLENKAAIDRNVYTESNKYLSNNTNPGFEIKTNKVVANLPLSLTLSKTDPTCGGSNGSITVTGKGGVLGMRSITGQAWLGISGTAVSNLTSNSNYPNSPSYNTALTSMEAPVNITDNFGGRIIGYLAPEITGTYYFWIASDDNGELWLSTNESAANKTRIASHTSYTGFQEWNKFPSQKSAAISLQAGKIYYIEAIYKEGGGDDHVSVGWAKPGESTTVPSEVIPADAIRPYTSAGLTTPTYQYKIGNGTFQNSNVFSGLAAGTYTVTIQDVYGATATSNITLANTTPSATANNNGPVCVGQTLSLTATVSQTASSYRWVGPGPGTNGFTSSTQNPNRGSATTDMSGIYTLTVTFSACAATVTSTTSVTVSSANAPSTTSDSRCGAGTVTLSADGCSGTYNWYSAQTGGTFLGSGSDFNTPSIVATTTYYVECKVGSCISTRTAATATVKTAVSASATGDTECEGSTINLSAGGGNAYSWAGPNGFSSNLQSPSISGATPAMSGAYTVTVTNTSSGCTDTAIANVVVNPIPVPIGADVARCGNGTVTLTATGCSNGVYSWYNSPTTANSLATGATYTTQSLSAPSTTYYVACTLNACTSTTRTPIKAIITSTPGAPSVVSGERCGTGSVRLTASGCSGTYNWYTTATGGSSIGAGGTFNTPSISTTTSYYVECNFGCPSTRTEVKATINPTPSAGAIGDTECEGTAITLEASGGGLYSWVGPKNFVSSAQKPTIPAATADRAGIYTVTVTDAKGCTATATARVVINPIPEAPAVVDVSRCGPGTVLLKATGCTGGVYRWYVNSTTSTILVTGDTYTTPTLSVDATYFVSCTQNSCESSTRNAIKAIITPVPDAPTTNAIERCGTGPVTLTADGCAGIVEWYEAASGGLSIGIGNYITSSLAAPATNSTSQANTKTYYAGCNVDGCRSTTRTPLVVTIKRLPTATASNTGQHCVGTTFKLLGGGTNAESYSWSGPNGFSSSEQSPIVYGALPAMGGIYTLTVTAANGCTATATTNLVINNNCNSACPTPIAVTPNNPSACTGTNSTNGYIFVTEYSAGPYYQNSLDGINWFDSEKTYSGLSVGYYTVFIRDKTSKIICRTIAITLTSANSSYFTAGTPTPATDCAATNGSIKLEGVTGTDNVSWISSTSRNFVKVSSLSPSNTISNLAPGDYYVVVSRGNNPLCYSERKIEVKNSGTACPPGLCTQAKSTNLFPGGDFGSGNTTMGPPLTPGETQYSFAPMNCDSPNDGNYTITNTTDCNGAGRKVFTTWDVLRQDHTPGDVNGYMMIVNASYNPDIVIERTVTNLCPNTRYEYSLWIYNICPAADQAGCTIKPNLTFLIDGVGKYTTGDITAAGWQQVGFTFTTGNTTTSTFSIRNNATGGNGNDWAIDDISIIQCLPTIAQSANITRCIGAAGPTISAIVTDANKQYTYYKWQESADGGISWTDLTNSTVGTFGANSTYTVTLTLPTITAAMNGRKYRIVVGTSTANLNNSSCSFNGNETTLTVPTISINISGNLSICASGSTTLTASASGGNSPYTYTWSNSLGTGASKTVTVSSSTTYTVTARDANSCSATASARVVVTPLPNAPTAVNASKCGAGTVELGATGCSGTVNWYASETGTSIVATGANYTTPSISVSTTYYVNCTVNGCVSASRTPVVATINDIPNATAGGDVQCAGSTINLSASGGNTYDWTGPAGFRSSVQNPAIANATNAMAGIYTVTVISAEGCSATATASVTVNPAPTPNISGTTSICEGQSTTLTATGGNSYLWSTGETTTSINVNPTTSTTYTLTAYTSNSSYANLVTGQTIFNAANFSYINSTASYAGPQSLFDGIDNLNADTFHATRKTNGQDWGIGYKLGSEYLITSLSLDARNDCCTDRAKGGVMQVWKNGSMVYQSSVVNGAGNSIISASPVPNVLGDEVRYIFLNGANTSSGETTLNFAEWIIGGAKVCAATKQVTVTVNSKPNATAVSNSPVCVGKTISLTASGGTTYQWSGPNGFSLSGATASINNATISTHAGIYTVTVTNASGCTATATTNVVINALPEITITSNSPVCAGQTLTFTATGGTTYSWTGPNGFASSLPNPSISSASSIHSGTYIVTVTNANSCTATASIIIQQPNALTAAITGTNVNCNGGNNGNATVMPSGGTAPYTYQWSNNAGTSATANNLTARVYTVTVTDSKNCTATATINITQPPVLTSTIVGTNVNCNGGNNGSATVTPSGGTAPYAYQWSNNAGTSATANNLSARIYTVTITDSKGCTATATINITQPPVLTSTIVGTNVNCNGGNNGSATVTPSGGTSPYTYQWSNNVGTSATANNLTARVYTVTVTDAKNCIATATINITQPDALVATANSNSPVCVGQTLTLTASGSTNYSWKGPNGYSSQSQNSGIDKVTSVAAGIYTVTVSNAIGCNVTATVNVVIYDLPQAPTVTGASRCDAGSLTLRADGCAGGVIQWYDAQIGGNMLGTGITFATTTLTQSTFYFASCFTNNCSSPSRTAGLARINSAPNAELIPVNSTCIASNPRNDARLLLNKYRNNDQYSYNIGEAYDSAMASAFVTIPTGGLVPASSLPNPTGNSQAYTVRIKNADGCTIDRTVILTKQCDGCVQDYCPPAIISASR